MSERDLGLQADRGYCDYGPERVLRLASVEHNNSKRLRLYCLWHGGACVLRGHRGASIHELAHDRAFSGPNVAEVRVICVVETTGTDHVRALHGALREAGFTIVG